MLLTVKQYAKRKRLSIPRINQLVRAGRIAGAYRLGPFWVIPAGATIDPPLKVKHRRKRKDARR